MRDPFFRGAVNRLFQLMARLGPGAETIRVKLHRARGVHIGQKVWIGYDVVLETSRPQLITIEDGVSISMRASIIAHFHGAEGVKIERDAFIGPGVIILPGVVIGHGAVVTAGSVVTRSVAPQTVVQGNPAVAIARCGVPLTMATTLKEFTKHVRPLVSSRNGPPTQSPESAPNSRPNTR